MLSLKLSEGTAARRRVPFRLVDDTDGKTAKTGITFSAGEIKISKNGGAEANHAGTVTELAGGLYYYEATAGELDTVGFIAIRFTKATCRTFQAVGQVVAFDSYDAVRQGLTALPNANAEAAGGLFTRGTGAGQLNQDANGRHDINLVAWRGTQPNNLTSGRVEVLLGAVTAGVIAAASFAAGALDAVWSTTTRLLTAGTNIVLAKGTGLTGLNDLDASAVRGAVGLASANLDTQLSAISAKLPAALVGGKMDSTLSAAERNSIASALLDLADGVETTYTVRQTLRLMAAVLLGKASGGPDEPVFRAMGDTADRVAMTADSAGNRTSVTLTP